MTKPGTFTSRTDWLKQQVKDRTARRMFRPSEEYEGVPPEDLGKFALMSDKERKQYRMARAKKLEAAPPKKQHKKQVSARRKKKLGAGRENFGQ